MRILTTDEYDHWINGLRNREAKFRINRYFKKLLAGSRIVGDCKTVRSKVTEIRFNFGPGYRVYVTQEGEELLLLLVGGDKSTQSRDIAKAVALAKEWREGKGSANNRV